MYKIILGAFFFIPQLTHAEIKTLGDVLDLAMSTVNDFLIPFLVSLALLAFFWRNIVSLFKKDELVSKAESKWYLFWGVIALFVMLSVWGLVGILADAFGIKNVVPQLGSGNNGGGGSNLPPCGIALPGTDCQ